MWVGRPEATSVMERVCDDDTEVVILLTNEEAKELRKLIRRDKHHTQFEPLTLANATARDKLDLGLELLGFK